MKNTVISPKFLVWKFCGKAHFPRFTRNYAETVPFHKIGEITVFFTATNVNNGKCDKMGNTAKTVIHIQGWSIFALAKK